MNLMNDQEHIEKQALLHISEMEQKKGRNHPLGQFRSWLEEADLLPGDKDWHPLRIHVAGTNGKGSVCSWLAQMARQKGLSTGLFTSPHLISHTERIQTDGKPVSLWQWDQIYCRYETVFEEKQMTMFEIDLWMALAYFKETRPDVLIVETGLGGSHDATTALDYDLCLITNIGFDHMAYLGNTIEEIAMAKAGILLPEVPAVLGLMDPAAGEVIEKQAELLQSPYTVITGKEIALLNAQKTLADAFQRSHLPDYQKENFLLALRGMEKLGLSFELAECEKLIASFYWKGRFEILHEDPLIAADGAHNLHGIRALCASIAENEFERCYFSVLADKQAAGMIEALREKISEITLVHFDTPRLADLADLAQKEHLSVCSYEQMLADLKTTEHSTLICGSLYFVGDLLRDFGRSEG